MTSELPASPSEIYTDDIEVFQLKALSLNFLKNISEITDEHILKLDPCHFCDKEILTLPLLSFTVLSYRHIYHRIYLKKYIIQSETRFSLCLISSCISSFELIREELALASGEYYMVSKNKNFRKKDPLSDNTIEDEDSLAGQREKKTEITTHDQVTSPIIYVEEIPELSDIIDSSQIRMDNSTNQTTEDDIANI
ncbi:6200_t:CDS:2 [Funneliformis mosseae]|uniref:6200_t:CDS:1 n=1 Tax=Funneliformis mosseae TaxID=27381 RepID=A0A9N9AGE7_FUNMO|nr:6200_t:CDS:2 [Funneliformis mosseae]